MYNTRKEKVRPFGIIKVGKKSRISRIPEQIIKEVQSFEIGWEPNAKVILLHNPDMSPIDLWKSVRVLIDHLRVKYGIEEEGEELKVIK